MQPINRRQVRSQKKQTVVSVPVTDADGSTEPEAAPLVDKDGYQMTKDGFYLADSDDEEAPQKKLNKKQLRALYYQRKK